MAQRNYFSGISSDPTKFEGPRQKCSFRVIAELGCDNNAEARSERMFHSSDLIGFNSTVKN